MWIRRDFSCNHCNKRIIIKLQVEDLESSKVIFHCPECNSKIYGDFNDNTLRLNNVIFIGRLKDEDVDYSIGYAGYLPCLISKGFDPISPFISTFATVCTTNAYNDNILFKTLYENKDILLRMNQFYFDKNYTSFDTELKRLDFNAKFEINKEKALIRFNEFFILALFNRQKYKELIENYISLIRDNNLHKNNVLKKLDKNTINNLFSEITIFINDFYDLYPDLRSFFSIRDVQKAPDFYHLNFDFNKIKSFYVDIFELNCKILDIIGELLTLSGYTLDSPKKKFKKMTNGEQINQLLQVSYFSKLKDILNHKMRNSIGHKSAKIEFNKQKIITEFKIKEEFDLNEFFEKIVQNIELMFANYYLLFTLKFLLEDHKNDCFLEFNKYNLEEPRDLVLILYFSDCHISPPALRKYDMEYWNLNYIYDLMPKINFKLNDEKNQIKVLFNNKELVKINKIQNSRWFRLCLKKIPQLKISQDISKIEIYRYAPKEFPKM